MVTVTVICVSLSECLVFWGEGAGRAAQSHARIGLLQEYVQIPILGSQTDLR